MKEKDIGATLKKLRLERHLTQKEVADKLNVSYQTISKWELNKSLPSLDMIVSLSILYNVTIDSIVFEKNQPRKTAYISNVLKRKILTSTLKKERIPNMNRINKKINHSNNFEDLFSDKGTFVSFYHNPHAINHDLSVNWLISFNEFYLELVNKSTKSLHKIAIEGIESVSFTLAKTYLGTAPGLFFSTKIILVIDIYFDNKHMVLLSGSISVFKELYQYLNDKNIPILDELNLWKEFNHIDSDKINEFIYKEIDSMLKNCNIKELPLYSN